MNFENILRRTYEKQMKKTEDKAKAYELENRCLSHAWDLDDEIYLVEDETYELTDFAYDIYDANLDELREVNKKNIKKFGSNVQAPEHLNKEGVKNGKH